jgi:alkyl sulfatase BDS1-like metallo-beta-lactamase superfamily hydrolase
MVRPVVGSDGGNPVRARSPGADEACHTADATLTLTKTRLIGLLGGDTSSPGIDTTGDTNVLQSLLGVLEKGDPAFNIVTP